MKSALLFRILFLLAAAGFGTAVVRAEDINAVKARMAQRQATVDAQKEHQLVGENNTGFLEARGAGADQKLIADENADRHVVYAALAAQTKTDAGQIGRARAQKIAASSKPGVWVQDATGAWRKK